MSKRRAESGLGEEEEQEPWWSPFVEGGEVGEVEEEEEEGPFAGLLPELWHLLFFNRGQFTAGDLAQTISLVSREMSAVASRVLRERYEADIRGPLRARLISRQMIAVPWWGRTINFGVVVHAYKTMMGRNLL